MAWADPLVAAVIAAVIAVQAVRILVSAFHVLTDRAAIAEALQLLDRVLAMLWRLTH